MTTSTISARSGRPIAAWRLTLRAPVIHGIRLGIGWSDVEAPLSFILPFVAYLWVGWRLGIDAHLLPGDSLARVANASSAVFSRDPHPESIGFVWSPFPSLLEVPLVWMSRLWPPLLDRGMAGVIVSSLAMAGTVATVRGWLADLGLAAMVRIGLVLALAVHPFIALYGANGMSEAGMVCFLVIAARRFARWLERDRVLDLVAAGMALATAYLFRYEVGAAVVAFAAAVGWISWRRSVGAPRKRADRAALRVAVGALPPLFTIALWAFVSWAVVGSPFAQFSSRYGNSSQVSSAGRSAGQVAGDARAMLFLKQLLVFGAPAMVCVVVLMFFGVGIAHRTTAALAMLGAPLVFQFASAVGGSTFSFDRYTIAAVPLGAMLAGVVVAKVPRRKLTAGAVGTVAVLGCLASVGLALDVIHHGSLASAEERSELAAIPSPYGVAAPNSVPPILMGARVAHDIDARHPGAGQVLTDTASTFTVLLNAPDQRDYVIPADRDAERVVADPSRFGVRYVLVGQPSATYDSVEAAWPGMFAHGAGIAHLVDEWGSARYPATHFRLYEMDAGSKR